MSGPTTEAGRRIIEAAHDVHRIRERGNWIVSLDHAIGGNLGKCDGCDVENDVRTIEAEAVRIERERIKAAVEAHGTTTGTSHLSADWLEGHEEMRAAVLRVIEE